MITDLKRDRVPKNILHDTVASFATQNELDVDAVLTSLWWAGLIGYCDDAGPEESHILSYGRAWCSGEIAAPGWGLGPRSQLTDVSVVV